MLKMNQKSLTLVAITSLVALGLLITGFLVLQDLLVSARPMGVAFAGHGAWPEHHHYDVSAESGRGEDAFQNLTAKIKNYNTTTAFYVQAEFVITLRYDIVNGLPTQYTIYTGIRFLNPGEVTVPPLDAGFGPLTSAYAGTYDVTANCRYRYSLVSGDWIVSDVKTFKFDVVP